MKLNTLTQRIFFFLLFGLAIAGTWTVFSPFLGLLFFAMLFAGLLQPVYRLLANRTNFKPSINTAIISVALLLVVVVPFYLGLVIIGQQAAQLADALAKSNDTQLGQLLNTFSTWLKSTLGINLQALVASIETFIRTNLGAIAAAIADTIGKLTGSILRVLFAAIMFSFLFVVLLPNWARLKAYLIRLSPLDTTISELYFERIGLMTRDVVLGTVGVSLIQTIIMWLVFALLNIPFAGVLALFVFFFALIPFLGISLITIPFSVILIAQGQWFGAIVILLVHLIIINNIELVLRPLITSKALKLHPALVILGIIGGLITYGLAGLFAGPIIVVVLTTSLEVFTNNYGQELNPAPEQA